MRMHLPDLQRLRTRKELRDHIHSTAVLCLAIFGSTFVACMTPLVGQDIEEGARVVSDSRDYSIQMQLEGWLEMPSAAEAETTESPPSLRLAAADGSGWIYGYRPIGVQPRLDEIVSERRRLMLEAGARDYRERRYFLGDSDQITASLSRYVAGGEVYLVLTAIRSALAVELVAATARGGGAERDVIKMLESVEFDEKPGAPLP